MGGGCTNSIFDLSTYGTISNGCCNTICRTGCYNTIDNGLANKIFCGQQFSTILNGCCNLINNINANNFIPYGCYNTTTCANSSASGLYACASRYSEKAWSVGTFNAPNNTFQTSQFVLWNRTTNNTPTQLYLDGTAVTQNLTIPNNSVMSGTITTMGIQETTGVALAYAIDSVVYKNLAGTATLVHSNNINQYNSGGGLNITPSVGNTPARIQVSVTGLAATNIRWMSYLQLTQITFA